MGLSRKLEAHDPDDGVALRIHSDHETGAVRSYVAQRIGRSPAPCERKLHHTLRLRPEEACIPNGRGGAPAHNLPAGVDVSDPAVLAAQRAELARAAHGVPNHGALAAVLKRARNYYIAPEIANSVRAKGCAGTGVYLLDLPLLKKIGPADRHRRRRNGRGSSPTANDCAVSIDGEGTRCSSRKQRRERLPAVARLPDGA